MAIRKNIRGITIELDAKTTGLQEAINNVEGRISSINKELRDLNNLLKFEPKSTELLKQKQAALSEQISATTEKLKKLKAAEAEVEKQFNEGKINAEQYRDFRKEIEQTESKLKGYKAELNELQNSYIQTGKAMQEAGKKWKESGQNMADVGKTLSKSVTAPITAIGVLATKSAIDFETGMAGVRKTTDLTADELAKMGQSLRDMAQEIPVGVVELTKLAETAGQLGIKKENIVDFTRTVADLSVATNIVGQEGATNMARFANIMQMSQKDFDRMGSSIVELGNNTATTEKEILDMSMRLAGASYQAKMSEADVLGIAAALSALGLESQAGGSAFSRVINRIQLAIDTGSDDLENFARVAGMTSSQFAKAWGDDAATALSTFIVGLSDTSKHGQTTNEILDEMGITEIRVSDALRRTTGANQLFVDSLAMSNRAWDENNALQTEAAIRYETTESKLSLAKNKLNDTAIELGNNLLPAVANTAEWVGDLVSKFAELPEGTQNTIVKMGALAAALGPVLTVVGNVKKAFGSITEGLGGFLEKIGKSEGAIGTFVNKIGTAGTAGLVGAIALAVTGVVALVKKLTEVPEEIKRVNAAFDGAQKAIEGTAAAAKAQIDTIDLLKKELDSLTGVESKSEAQKQRLVEIVEKLNELMPELNLEYDKEADKLSLVGAEIDNVIAASKARIREEVKNKIIQENLDAEVKALEELVKAEASLGQMRDSRAAIDQAISRARLAGLTDEQIQFAQMTEEQRTHAGVQLDLSDEQQKAIDGVIDAVGREAAAYEAATGKSTAHWTTSGNALQDLELGIGRTIKILPGLQAAYDNNKAAADNYADRLIKLMGLHKDQDWTVRETTRVVEDSHRKMTGAVVASTDKQGAALDSISDKYGEEAKKQEEYQKAIETGTESHLNSMSGFSKKKLDLAKTTTAEYIKHLNEEVNAFTNYHTNLNTIAARVGPDVAEHLQKLGPEAAPLIAQFVKASDKELGELAVAVRRQMNAATNEAKKGAPSLGTAGKETALDYLRGVLAGLKDKHIRKRINKEAGAVGSNMSWATKNKLLQRSPSKVGIEIGENYAGSVGMGIRNAMKQAGQAASDMAGSIIDKTTLEPPRLLSSAQVDGRSAIASLDKSSSQHITSGDIVIQEMIVRDDNDIRLIARELHDLQQGQLRGRGIA